MTFPKLVSPSLDKFKGCLSHQNKKCRSFKYAYIMKMNLPMNNKIWKDTHAPQVCNLMIFFFIWIISDNCLMNKNLIVNSFDYKYPWYLKTKHCTHSSKKLVCLMQWTPFKIKSCMSLLRKRTDFSFSQGGQSTRRRKAKLIKNEFLLSQ